MFGFGERAPWGDFPSVIRNGDLFTMKSHPGYLAAKAGNPRAALDVIQTILTEDTLKKVDFLTRDAQPTLLPVLAAETMGYNKIPLAMAEVLGHRLGLEVDHGIAKRANCTHRLQFRSQVGMQSDIRWECNT